MTALPAWLSAALQSKLENVSRAALRASAQAISERYRAGGASDIIRSDFDALAYAVVRMPATYAAVRTALAQAAEIIPGFAPQSLIDAGAGPGTATWAGIDAWPSLSRLTLLDSNPRLLDLALQFGQAAGGPSAAMTAERGQVADILGQARAADVVTASYVLTELSTDAMRGVLDKLWERAGRLLVIVEPGTPDGFKRILSCRDRLLSAGAQIVAPCSHDGACPLAAAERWCHFSARLPRSRDHLVTKGANVPFEDEKFCYLVAGKGFADLARGRRVLATPRVSKAHIGLTLCAPGAAGEYVVGRAEKDAYKAAKRLAWGDAL